MRWTRWTAWSAALLAVLAVVALWLPWWRSPKATYRYADGTLTDDGRDGLPGTEVVGSAGSWLVVLAAFVVLLAVAHGVRTRSRAGWWWLAGAGVALVTVAVAAAGSWGMAPGSAVTLVAGLAVAGVALVTLVRSLAGWSRLLPAATVLLAIPVWFVPAQAPEAVALTSGPLRQVIPGAQGIDGGPPRGGASVLPSTSWVYTLVPANGGTGIALPGGILAVDDGRVTVLVRNDDTRTSLLGVVDDRLVAAFRGREVRVVAPGGKPAVVNGSLAVGSLSSAGVLLLTTGDAHDPTVRRLEVSSLAAGAIVEATSLPVVRLPRAARVDDGRFGLRHLLEHPGSRRIVAGDSSLPSDRLFTAAPGDQEWTPLAGGLDERCGLTASAAESYLPEVDAVAPVGEDGWWLAITEDRRTRLLWVTGEGEMHATAPFSVGTVNAIVPVRDTSVLVMSSTGLWRLPAGSAAALPDPPPGCVVPG
ncbi:hypothetical protein [Actinophytocola sediminis]